MDNRNLVFFLREALLQSKRTHSYCEDTFYCCPKQEDYCGNDDSGECNCGADDVNLMIDSAIILADQYLDEGSE